jgi:hypothetical protein
MKTGMGLLLLVTGLCSCSRSTKETSQTNVLVVDLLKKHLPESEDKREQFLVRTFFKEERKFDSYTTDNWKSNFTAFSSLLVQKAEDHKLDSASLRSVLDLVLKDSQDKLAYLPIGAYQATLAGKPVWIVAVKREYPTTEMGTLPLGHIRAFAFDQKTLSRVAFMTCN